MAEILKNDESNEELVTLDITNDKIEENTKLKEYQKLLFSDEARLKVVRAKELIRLGCFDQYQKKVGEVNFNDLKKLEYAKKYKDHELYENVVDNTLYYIEILDEEDKEGNKKVYGYDIVEIDNVDEETFDKLLNAHKHQSSFGLNLIYTLAWVFCFLGFISIVFASIHITSNGQDFFVALFQTCATPLNVFAVSLSALTVATIAKKNHDDKK